MRKKYERNETVIKIDDAEKRKKILELLVDRIYIYDEEVVVTFFFCDDQRRLNIF